MNNNTIEKMMHLKLPGMAAEFERQLAIPTSSELAFEHRIRSMVDHEMTLRDNKRLQVLMKKARLSATACIEDINYRAARGMDKSTMQTLTTLDWVRLGHNLVLTGRTGTGKTWLACALGNQACRMGMTTYFIKVTALLENLVAAHATNTFHQRLEQLKKIELLIIDEWGNEKYTQRAQIDLLELLDSRLGFKSTIITSQVPMEKWHDAMDNKTVADAIMDRIVHSSYHMPLVGKSLREANGIGSKLQKK